MTKTASVAHKSSEFYWPQARWVEGVLCSAGTQPRALGSFQGIQGLQESQRVRSGAHLWILGRWLHL